MGHRSVSLDLTIDAATAAGSDLFIPANVNGRKVCPLDPGAPGPTTKGTSRGAKIDTDSSLHFQVPASMLSARFATSLVPDDCEISTHFRSAGQGLERRLLAVLAVDVEGYCRLVEVDEIGTYKRIRDLRRQILKPIIANHHGRMLNFCGDGALVTFGSAVSAVQCAVMIQDKMKPFNERVPASRRIRVRIGVSIDDAIVSDGDVYGPGVNVASRLEAKAEPGGILISGAVFDQINSRLPIQCQALGRRRLRNFSKRVRVYSVATAEDYSDSLVKDLHRTVTALPEAAAGAASAQADLL